MSANVFFIAECMAVGNSLLYSINWPSLENITAIKRKVKISLLEQQELWKNFK